jgi:hypothetical protein
MNRVAVARELVKIAKELVSRTEFDTRQYVSTYGHEPRGRGSWAFALDADGWKGLKFTPSMTYKEAKRWALSHPEFKGVDVIYVQT